MKNGFWFSAFGFWKIFIQVGINIRRPKTENRKPFIAENHLNYFNYFTEIEETFIRRRGRNLLLSPLDWALIENWQEREIPLYIILRAIETVFDTAEKRPDKKRAIKSLSYCKEEIEAQFAEWAEMQTGKPLQELQSDEQNLSVEAEDPGGELFSKNAIADHLNNVYAELERAKVNSKGDLQETYDRVLNRLVELQKDIPSAEKLEESLEKLDALIDESLLSSGSGEKLSVLKQEIEKNLAEYKAKMEQEVYERTFNLMLIKRLREEAEIPRLSLFYI